MNKRGKIEQTDEDDFAQKNPSIFSMLLLMYIHQNNERKKINESASRKVCLTTSVYDICAIYSAK